MDGLLIYPATYTLIALNVIASIVAFNNHDFFERYVFWIAPIRQGEEWYRFVTSAFLHVNGLHLFINMYVLYMFGQVLEQHLGSGGFLILYSASLLGGNVWEFADKHNQPDYRAVGASGATSGVVSGFCLFFPFAVLYLFFAIPMWAIVFGVGFIVVSFILSQRDQTMVAHGAHLGGALTGLAIAMLLRPESWRHLIDQVIGRLG
ncbi:rhomboid family intramembrane serine protease [Hyphomonas johnsonii]|jgi:membrane associated rhomboid family serine protease|uniref:S54 family peptidase n=1 Tax=Hyphomonas johnsonii MHS-2 TaxID=1280950 RepID=A0A059FHF5_9PROT|nr:rhomboid family intramembrane serine protease [Hyphomonas johnsonii]KCZ89981.1 S54 family peptidase [Hyphomonas johnsonii MHS-2]